ncbi:MAG: mechanosensitive ion channel [Haliea sp.]|nr:mechanosensitive ion channel [Haliea sp.]
MDTTSLNAMIGTIWSVDTALYLAAILVMSGLLWQRCPDAHRTLRNTLYLLGISLIGLALTEASFSTGSGGYGPVYHSALVLLTGAAVIRLLGLFLFRVIFELLRIRPPSILEEILVVVAYFVWAMLQLHRAGVPLGEIITTSAIATAVLAFAMQDTLGNILGGLALQWDHSLKIGDWVRVGDVEGRIVDIKWRAISLETRNWETVVIPNGMMMKNQFMVLGERTNEEVKWRRWIWFNVDYSASPDRVIQLAEDSVTLANIPDVAGVPRPNCLLMEIDGSTARYALRYWLTDLARDDPTDSSVRQHIYAALNRQNLRLAMPRQHLYLTKRNESYLHHKQQAEITRRIDALTKVDLFHSLSEEELENLARRIEHRPYATDDFIFRQGDIDHHLYIITEGKADVTLRNDSGQECFAFSLDPGEFFGEIGMMTGDPRAASVKAASPLNCYVLGKDDFSALLMTRDEIIEEISQVVVSRQSALEQARNTIQPAGEERHSLGSVHDLVARIRHFLGTEQA